MAAEDGPKDGDDVIDLSVDFHDSSSSVKIRIYGFDDYKHVIAALRKLGQTDYLLALHDQLRGIESDDYDDDDYDD